MQRGQSPLRNFFPKLRERQPKEEPVLLAGNYPRLTCHFEVVNTVAFSKKNKQST